MYRHASTKYFLPRWRLFRHPLLSDSSQPSTFPVLNIILHEISLSDEWIVMELAQLSVPKLLTVISCPKCINSHNLHVTWWINAKCFELNAITTSSINVTVVFFSPQCRKESIEFTDLSNFRLLKWRNTWSLSTTERKIIHWNRSCPWLTAQKFSLRKHQCITLTLQMINVTFPVVTVTSYNNYEYYSHRYHQL